MLSNGELRSRADVGEYWILANTRRMVVIDEMVMLTRAWLSLGENYEVDNPHFHCGSRGQPVLSTCGTHFPRSEYQSAHTERWDLRRGSHLANPPGNSRSRYHDCYGV